MVPVATERLIGSGPSTALTPAASSTPLASAHAAHHHATQGINIEVVDQGVNGVVISSLVRNGAVHKDGRLHAGDLILSVNNESMRNITNSQARAILRRTQLVSTDVR
ncbi:Multiple PDZ domain protein [Portunus trituberculatus]|uniref:Multiple PDZ domain protein n=1 Tax=Portunus trituberculatus TaxID=210409 RepID=A0A5B7G0Y8_PORTR|nr:Multiple PDZ domain protein [Portunus trituberculatus]